MAAPRQAWGWDTEDGEWDPHTRGGGGNPGTIPGTSQPSYSAPEAGEAKKTVTDGVSPPQMPRDLRRERERGGNPEGATSSN